MAEKNEKYNKQTTKKSDNKKKQSRGCSCETKNTTNDEQNINNTSDCSDSSDSYDEE